MLHAPFPFLRLAHRNTSSWKFLGSDHIRHAQSLNAVALYRKIHDVRSSFSRRPYDNESSCKSDYISRDKSQEAISLCRQLQHDDATSSNKQKFVGLLKACAKSKDLKTGSDVHAKLERAGLIGRDIFIGSSLIDMYVKCGKLDKAQKVFDELPIRNVVCWNALLCGYVEHDHGKHIFQHLKQMKQEGITPDAVTFICIVKACIRNGDIAMGLETHAEIERQGLRERKLAIGNALVDMYAKCGLLAMAQEVFDKLPGRDVVSWTTLIAGYVEHGHGWASIEHFEEMRARGVPCNFVTYACILKACGSIGASDKGEEIHDEIERIGLFEENLFLSNALVDMYAKCGILKKAQQVFDKIPVRDVISWTSMISGYTERGYGQEAIDGFELMELEGVHPDVVTFLCALKACGSIANVQKGQDVHAKAERQGLLDKNIIVNNALIDMYLKCGSLKKAQNVFDRLLHRNLVSWNTLISGYVEHGFTEEAVNCFERMQFDGVSPDGVTYVCILKACASLGATWKGVEIHIEIESRGLLGSDVLVGSTLVDMYARCGSLEKAQQVFDKLVVRDVVSWTAIMEGYAQLGESIYVFNSFDGMIREGIKPDPVTFVVLLNACSRVGSFARSQTYFEAMTKCHGITPSLQHYGCMVDLLVRTGQLAKAMNHIENIPFSPNIVVWRTVLSACRNWGSTDFAEQAYDSALHLIRNGAMTYSSEHKNNTSMNTEC